MDAFTAGSRHPLTVGKTTAAAAAGDEAFKEAAAAAAAVALNAVMPRRYRVATPEGGEAPGGVIRGDPCGGGAGGGLAGAGAARVAQRCVLAEASQEL